MQVEFLTGQVAGAQAELVTRSDATSLLKESEQARREVILCPLFQLRSMCICTLMHHNQYIST